MIINNFYRIYLTFILINFTICSEITEHFLGANFDMNNKSATFIDKIKCIWLDIEWGNYGPFGLYTRFDGFVLPNYSNQLQEKYHH